MADNGPAVYELEGGAKRQLDFSKLSKAIAKYPGIISGVVQNAGIGRIIISMFSSLPRALNCYYILSVFLLSALILNGCSAFYKNTYDLEKNVGLYRIADKKCWQLEGGYNSCEDELTKEAAPNLSERDYFLTREKNLTGYHYIRKSKEQVICTIRYKLELVENEHSIRHMLKYPEDDD